jgi:hypothetical protein
VLILLIGLIIAQVSSDAQHCYQYSEEGLNGYTPVDACHNHSQAFCDGCHQGYRDAVSSNGKPRFQQGKSSQVHMDGNNFVDINQAQNLEWS